MIARPALAQGSADVVLEWNRILITALNVPGANPATTFVTRPFAITHVAIFDALNAIDPQYVPYTTVAVNPAVGASRDVAAAQAAHDVLVALLPSQAATFDAALAAAIARTDAASAAGGAAVGAAAAKAILAVRGNDG